MNTIIVLLLILVMVGFNALYVAAEFATVGSRRSRVQENAESGSGPARGLLEILQDPKRLDNYVAACQIGITLSSLVAGADLLFEQRDQLRLAIGTGDEARQGDADLAGRDVVVEPLGVLKDRQQVGRRPAARF